MPVPGEVQIYPVLPSQRVRLDAPDEPHLIDQHGQMILDCREIIVRSVLGK
ncbi:hypothetical protein D3C86_2000220 [compost metagenome]